MASIVVWTWLHHSPPLLLLAAAIWLLGSVSFFTLLKRSRECGPRRRRQWTAIGALVGGIGVWATHFVAMLAHRDEMPVRFSAPFTAASVIEAIALFWLALLVLLPATTVKRCAFAGLVATLGVGAMHFTGMAAIEAPVHLHYELAPILWAFAITAGLFAGAFVAFARLKGAAQVLIPAGMAVGAVCTLHFTSMAATLMVCDAANAGPLTGGERIWLISAVVLATTTLLVLTGAGVVIERYLTDLHGLADATLEGLAIIQGDRIVEANERFGQMLGSEASLIGASPDLWLLAADAHAIATPRAEPVEASPVSADQQDRVLEVATHSIEYRGRESIVLAVRDLTEKKAVQRRIEHMARHDALTDLPNRVLLDERLVHGLARARREAQSVALLALDLDRFKAVNDIFGHSAGDAVLCRVARILSNTVRSTDTIARIGGDEFMILQVGAEQPAGARALAARILADLAREMDTAKDPMAVGASIGVALFPEDAADADGLRHAADIALYRAKELGRGGASFFDQDMDTAVRERRALEHDLRHAIQRRQFRIAYQPLVNTADSCISGYEALLRWTHPDRGAIAPDVFIPIAEESGSIVQIGEWVLREACAAARSWPEHIALAVNVSAIQFQVQSFPSTVERVLLETGLAPNRLELEITESVLMKDRAGALSTLRRIKAMGVRIVMDDFGTGYSSLSNLQIFPIDKIKIDRSFVAALQDDAAARSIIRAIVGIGRSLELPVVAEGVETEAQHRMVLEEGCPQAQGFLFGRPEAMDTLRVQARGHAA
jgi:diguanylate cyclase (GGDEF)-like protein